MIRIKISTVIFQPFYLKAVLFSDFILITFVLISLPVEIEVLGVNLNFMRGVYCVPSPSTPADFLSVNWRNFSNTCNRSTLNSHRFSGPEFRDFVTFVTEPESSDNYFVNLSDSLKANGYSKILFFI